MKSLLTIFVGSLITVSFWAMEAVASPTLDQDVSSSEVIISDSPQINAAYYNYNFGYVPVNASRTHRFNLTNDSGKPVFVNNVVLFGNGFYGWNHCYGWLMPWQRCSTRVNFQPWYEGYHSGRLIFYLNTNTIYINLYGWGVRW